MKWMPYSTLALLLTAGCASKVPEAIRQAPAAPITIEAVQQAPQAYQGQRVRWGGELIEVRNGPDHSDLVVLARPLDDKGEPPLEGTSLGRFMARFTGFLDPAAFPTGKRITVVGRITGVETHPIGRYPYPYPVIQGEAWHLWPDPEPQVIYSDPWWPWYPPHPWGPWGYPYWW